MTPLPPLPVPLTLVALAKDILLEPFRCATCGAELHPHTGRCPWFCGDGLPHAITPYNGPVCWYCSEPLPADVANAFEDPNTGAVYCSSRCLAMADADNEEDGQ